MELTLEHESDGRKGLRELDHVPRPKFEKYNKKYNKINNLFSISFDHLWRLFLHSELELRPRCLH